MPEGTPRGPVTTADRIEAAATGRRPDPAAAQPDAPSLSPNHPLVRVRRHHQAIVLDVSDCSVDLTPAEALRLMADMEAILVPLGFLEPR